MGKVKANYSRSEGLGGIMLIQIEILVSELASTLVNKANPFLKVFHKNKQKTNQPTKKLNIHKYLFASCIKSHFHLPFGFWDTTFLHDRKIVRIF